MNTSNASSPARGRRQLLALAALFFVPLGLAFWLYYGPTSWRPGGGSNKGELIDPARPLPAISLQKIDGTPAGADFLRGKWTMLYVGDGSCDARCRQALYLTRQSRLALNKDMDRVQRVFLVTGPDPDVDFLAREHADLVAVRLAGPDAARLLATIPAYGDGPVGPAGRIYLVDPLGNLLMSYAASAPDRALLEDLKKLLRLSHIG